MKEAVRILIKMLEQPPQYLREMVGNIPDDRAGKLLITAAWSLRDVIAHLVTWVEEFDREVRYLVETGADRLPWTVSSGNNYAEWNQARIDEMQGLSASTLLHRLDKSNGRLAEFIGSLSDEQLSQTAEIPWYSPPHLSIRDLVSVKAYHESCHIDRIRKKVAAGQD